MEPPACLISWRTARPSPTPFWYLEERGTPFITTGTKLYQGMIIGENSRDK